MITTKDQLNRELSFPEFPSRIVSLVPSLTELLHDLDLDREVAGITKFCIHPESWHQSKARVGGTKNLNLEKIRLIRPDLIIANKEENEAEQIRELMLEFPVWVSDVKSFEDALSMIRSLSSILNRKAIGETLAAKIDEEFSSAALRNLSELACTYLIWKTPLMTIGGDTFINTMLEQAGFVNTFRNYSRYPEITIQQLIHLNPDLLLLSSEPFPFSDKHITELREQTGIKKILLVDGEMFSWYGSRMLLAPSYFLKLRGKIDSEL